METLQDLGTYTFPALLKNSVKKFAERPALCFVEGEPFSYSQVAQKTVQIAQMLKGLGLCKGSKVAILSTGRPEWGITYFSIVNYGMICVPLLPDFSEVELQTIFAHCEVDAIFIEQKLLSKIEKISTALPKYVISIEDFSVLKVNTHLSKTQNENSFLGKTLDFFKDEKLLSVFISEDDTASIIYTSGTTGRSKGVELSHKNLVWCAVYGQFFHRVNKFDKCLSFLPLSHVYEFTIGFLMQILNGSCVYYLGKPPVVNALLSAFKSVQPTIVLSVPLVMEKIYKAKVVPELTKTKFLKFLYGIRIFQKQLHKIAGKSLKKKFGGRLEFFGIGGAKVDPAVERFMKDAKFPYAIGYGLTETSPLLAGSGVRFTSPGKIGVAVPEVQLKINNPDPKTHVGEVVAKGPNVMKGYYKDELLTKQAFTTDEDSVGEGFFKTGDLGIFKKYRGKQYLILKGRNKNMILGPSGENIYPEDIEFVLNQHPLVTESLVVEDDSGLVALVQMDEEKLNEKAEQNVKRNENLKDLVKEVQENFDKRAEEFKNAVAYEKARLINEIQFYINCRVNKNSKISKIQTVSEFQKTATQKIKRFLYDLRSKKSGKN
ncbi:AMP-binding protein [Treponema pectinovorum]|uniref:AMP-binding protein n=1 Tax=Treponema pectinovorum TaxID=164 RepID=UPI0011C9B9BF|nr:AMP-binding protein [Treponema pectinovorum]